MVVSPTNAILMAIFNILVIYYLLKNGVKTRMKSFVYFLNLAASDLFLGMLILAVKMMMLFEKKGINSALTSIRIFMQMKAISISLYISALTFAVLTFERMLAVKKPIYYSLIHFRTKCMISLLIWFLATSVIVILHFTVHDDELEYVLTPAIIFATSLLGIVCYILTKRGLERRSQTSNSPHQIEGRRFMKFCIKSFILFLICWLPLAVFGVLFSSGILHNWKYMLEFRFTAHIVAFLNSVGSPMLFLSQNQRWKRIFRKQKFVEKNMLRPEIFRMKQIILQYSESNRTGMTFCNRV